MTRILACLIAVPLVSAAGEGTVALDVRGGTQTITRITQAGENAKAAVLFLPGDGGWRGAAVSMGRTIGSWGYEVFGFDTKRYLENVSQSRGQLRTADMAADVEQIAGRIGTMTNKPVVLVGWSQGAAMAVAAASTAAGRGPVHGIVALGLPANGVLGWDWKATLASIAGREPDQPKFATKPLLQNAAATPIWMIHGSADEFTTTEVCRDLYQAASAPKQLHEVAGANHRFDGHLDELNRWMREGLEWLTSK
jgi:predicted esterase